MARKIDFARDSRHKALEAARDFPTKESLNDEKLIIDKMKRPGQWKRDYFIIAIRGNYIAMWAATNTNGRPKDWKDQERYSDALKKYLLTPEGIGWQNANDTYWLKRKEPPEGQEELRPIKISLPSNQKTLLEKLAVEWGIDESATARILLSLSLRQIGDKNK